ncbi:MAG: hypothetical protein HY042_05105 [Spirochaetia bacterium]|nr:hypothetical protein [Spirochaetia bacterium]
MALFVACSGGQIEEKRRPQADQRQEAERAAQDAEARQRREQEERRSRERRDAQARAEAQEKQERERLEADKRRAAELERERDRERAAREQKQRDEERAKREEKARKEAQAARDITEDRTARDSARRESEYFQKEKQRYLEEREKRRRLAEANDKERSAFWRTESRAAFGKELIITVPEGRVCIFLEVSQPLQSHGLTKSGVRGDGRSAVAADLGNNTDVFADRRGNWIPLIVKKGDSRRPAAGDIAKGVPVKLNSQGQTTTIINVSSDGDGNLLVEAEADDEKAKYYVWSVDKITLRREAPQRER